MLLIFKNHDYKYAVEQLLLTLFPDEKPEYGDADDGRRPMAVVSLSYGKSFVTAHTRLFTGSAQFDGRSRASLSELDGKLAADSALQRILKLSFYKAGVAATGRSPAWGALTGIRPGKLASKLIDAGKSPGEAAKALSDAYYVAPEKAALCVDAALTGLSVRRWLAPRDISLYIGVPFCPTRCAYCSFVSHSVEKSMKLMSPFTDALLLEIAAAGKAVRDCGARVVTVYMGGGTPTTLSEGDLDRVLSALADNFDLSSLREYSVEAGRPDTLTPGKLAVLTRHAVTRVSVNPQTMRDEVLEVIGRRHTAEDIRHAVRLVRDSGDFSLNMDLIAGLPQDSAEGFEYSLREVLALAPENITVHTLALKRGSRLRLEGSPTPGEAEVAAMLSFASGALKGAGFSPYYLYRQKFMAGSFENVGWSLPGFESIYNVCIMEELQTILALGAGGVTKLTDSARGHIERLFNAKYPQEYLASIGKAIAAKDTFAEFMRGVIGE